MTNFKAKNIDAYVSKFKQLLLMIRSHQLQGKIVDNSTLDGFMKHCTYPKTRNGLSHQSYKVLKEANVLQHNSKIGYHIDPDRINDGILKEAALVLLNHNRSMNNGLKSNVQKQQKHDIIQPTLFTESVMREQERPIVTANDQMIQRLEALEAEQKTMFALLSKIITFFKSL